MKTLFVGFGFAALAAAAADIPAAPAPYVLFMGANFSVESGSDMYRVENVAGSSFIVLIANRRVHISSTGRPVTLEVKKDLKLGHEAANLTKYFWERDYLPGTSPEQKAAVAYTNLVGEMQDVENVSQSNTVEPNNPMLVHDDQIVASSLPWGTQPATGFTQQSHGQTSGQIMQAFGNQLNQDNNETMSTNAYVDAQRQGAAADLRNALHIKFDLTCPRDLRRPYVMFVAIIHQPGHLHQKQQWIGGSEVDPVTNGRTVHFDFFQGGFPAGFQVDKLSAYLFDDGGREVATNLSDDRVDLTRERAFQFVVLDYLGSHRRSTLPATPAMTHLPADWQHHAGEPWFKETYFVKVDKAGHAQGIFADPDCRQPANAYLSGMITGVWFRPALDKGKPVDTVVQVVPRTLVE